MAPQFGLESGREVARHRSAAPGPSPRAEPPTSDDSAIPRRQPPGTTVVFHAAANAPPRRAADGVVATSTTRAQRPVAWVIAAARRGACGSRARWAGRSAPRSGGERRTPSVRFAERGAAQRRLQPGEEGAGRHAERHVPVPAMP